MKAYDYILDVPNDDSRQLAKGWLFLALASLILGGLLTILIVLSRTPGVQTLIPWTDFFHTAIIVHVDLTVLVWFLSIAGIFWSLNSTSRCLKWGKISLLIAAVGTGIFTISPFIGAGEPLMNNYIPILQHPFFLIGLGIFGLGFLLMVLRSLFTLRKIENKYSPEGVLKLGMRTALLASLFSIIALALTYIMMPGDLEGRSFYELLFWGGGHILQFTHTQLLLVAWLCLATTCGIKLYLNPKIFTFFILLGFSPILFSPLIYVLYDVTSADHVMRFTQLMQFGNGIAALPVGIVLGYGLLASKFKAQNTATPERMALYFSILLFAAGGIIGFLISGINVTIPAHYHGSIVAVTLAFMGVVYHLLPRLGFEKPMGRMANIQPVIYGGGQLMHILGLAWSGGYGVQRKTAGVAQGLDSIQEIAGMAMMGLGGLISVVGGLLFLIVALRCIWRSRSGSQRVKIKHRVEEIA